MRLRPAIMLPALLAFSAITAIASAHADGGAHSHGHAFESGLMHPLTGLDHLLAMIAVGLWAMHQGGRMIWVLPVVFSGVMLLSGMAGMMGTSLPLMESGIAASVLMLGLLLATTIKLPTAVPVVLLAVFAVFHGWAHGAEMAPGMAALDYSVGFVLATLSLHAVGLALGLGLTTFFESSAARTIVTRATGSAIAAAGLFLLIA